MQQHQQNLEKTIWMEEEKKIFKEKFSPKIENNFAKVSEFINKDVKECIQFYYLNKKENLRKTVWARPVNIKRLRRPRRKNIWKVKATTTKIILQNWNYTSNSIDENINDIIIIGNEQSVAEAKKKIEALIQNMMRESTSIIPPLQSP